MKYLSLVVFLFLLSSAILAQEKATSISACVNLTATPAVFQVGEIVVIIASSPNNLNTVYRWEVKNAEIIKGQDTDSIEVRVHSQDVITAKVEARNGETACVHSITLEPAIGCGLGAEVDRYGKLSLAAERARLDNVAFTFAREDSKKSRILFIAEFGANLSRTSVIARLARAKKYLIEQHKIDSSKILLLLSEDKNSNTVTNSTVIYILPEDFPSPPDNSNLITDEEISKSSKKVSQTKQKKN